MRLKAGHDEEIRETAERGRRLITLAIKRRRYDGLLFSGGLDTSIIAAVNPKTVGITVSLGAEAEDIYYSGILAKSLNLRQILHKVDDDEALEAVPEVIKILRSFDPAIPNDLAVYFGLKKARELGMSGMATGDASDELFGGYSFMQDIADLEGYIRKISGTMTFSSNEIGRYFGMDVIQPFVEKDIVDFALNAPIKLKIRKDNGTVWGKWILRKAFEELLPYELVWQSKRPLEVGSGMTKLRSIISDKISDDEFRKHSYPVSFLNKEHLYYYKIYREVIGEIPRPGVDEKACPCCNGAMGKDSFHCKICGYVLDSKICAKRGGDKK